jgi:hypothetical protein
VSNFPLYSVVIREIIEGAADASSDPRYASLTKTERTFSRG